MPSDIPGAPGNVDQARLLPVFRAAEQRARLHAEHAKVFQTELRAAIDEGRNVTLPSRPQIAHGDPRDLRGIPVVGVAGAGGAIKGTQPEIAVMIAFG